MGGKGGGSSASSKIDVNSKSTSSVDVLGLDDLNAELTLHLPQPLTTKSSSDVELKPLEADVDLDTTTHLKVDPLVTTSNMNVDMKPAVVDLCLTANVGKLPNVCIRQPYAHHIGITLYGSEIWGISFSGEQQTVIDELDRQPQVAWGGTSTAWPPAPAPSRPATQPASRQSGGLRVRLGP